MSALLLLLAALYWKWREFGREEWAVGLPAVAWAAWMAEYAGEAFTYFFHPELSTAVEQNGLAVLAWLLGIAAVATTFFAFRSRWGASALQVLTWSSGVVGIFGLVAAYQWLDESYMPQDWTTSSVEGGLTSLLAIAAVAAAGLAGKWRGCDTVATVLALLAAVRVVYLHLITALLASDCVLFTGLLLQFGIPFVAASALAVRSGQLGQETARRVYQIGAMVLGFVWFTLLVQYYFEGRGRVGSDRSNIEIYTYSVVWLLLAVAYQAVGLLRHQPAMHVGSLVLLLVTIGKVFLVDAAELEGLFRVLSFLGLGLALIGIGYFYNRVIFTRQRG